MCREAFSSTGFRLFSHTSRETADGEGMNRVWVYTRFTLFLVAGLTALSGPLSAAESGKSLYLLGRQGPVAALNPDKGWHLTNDLYYYNADNDGTIPTGNNKSKGNSVDAFRNIAQVTWVTGARFLGARVAMGVTVPYGTVKLDANSTSQGNNPPNGNSDSERDTGFGDPEFLASLAWRQEREERFFSASFYSSVFIPVGSYNDNSIANMGSNRWGVDVGTAFDGAHYETGGEMSGVIGYTINGENEDTDYETGNEFHAELSLLKRLSSRWGVGVAGYFYKQITGDNGGPVELGSFKGRVEGLGPQLDYKFTAVNRPMKLNLRWYHEFSSKNRAEGDSVFLTFSVPIAAKTASVR